MAFKAFAIAVVITAIIAPALATQYIVGDTKGWSEEVDYANWARDKTFKVGDTLLFMYDSPILHNVVEVSESDLQKCEASNSINLFTSGNDTITLDKPGKKCYICNVSDHCIEGMKLVVDVVAAEGSDPVVAAEGSDLSLPLLP